MKYLVKFEKKGMMIFISHLDTQRLFHRVLKQSGAELKFSSGFNPHPAISFALPLSVGYYSASEYVEFETLTPLDIDRKLVEGWNKLMPEGIKIIDLWSIPEGGKSAASLVTAAKYQIIMPYFSAFKKAFKDFAEAESVIIDKYNKKTGNLVSVNIKPQIVSVKVVLADKKNIVLIAALHSTLNPEVMLRGFYSLIEKPYDRLKVRIERVSIMCQDKGELAPLERVLTERSDG